MNFQSRVKAARRLAGMSQADLADVLGVRRSAVSHWESPSPHRPAAARLEDLARATGVSFEWLATGRGAMTLNLETLMDDVPAADAMLVVEALEMRFIEAFRRSSLKARLALLDIAEQLGDARVGKRGRSLGS